MIAFADYRQLKDLGSRVQAHILKEASRPQEKNLFLSHSSADHQLVSGVLQILEDHGGRVYIDEKDLNLPKNDFTKTAARLRGAVKECNRFVLLVTPNSKESRWIPWELGLGDGQASPSNVALFPSAEYSHEQNWSETEYLGLYARIVWANFEGQQPEWLVYNHHDNSGKKLQHWIRGY